MPGKITSYNNVSPSFAVASAYFECSCLFSCLLTFTIPASESSFGTAFPGSCIATLYLCTLPLFLLPCWTPRSARWLCPTSTLPSTSNFLSTRSCPLSSTRLNAFGGWTSYSISSDPLFSYFFPPKLSSTPQPPLFDLALSSTVFCIFRKGRITAFCTTRSLPTPPHSTLCTFLCSPFHVGKPAILVEFFQVLSR